MKKLDLLNSNDSYRCCKLLKDLNLFSRADKVNWPLLRSGEVRIINTDSRMDS